MYSLLYVLEHIILLGENHVCAYITTLQRNTKIPGHLIANMLAIIDLLFVFRSATRGLKQTHALYLLWCGNLGNRPQMKLRVLLSTNVGA